MYVTDGARDKLLTSERERFLNEEWPAMVERIQRLGPGLSTSCCARPATEVRK